MDIVKQDILEMNSPALSATSDVPVIETKPDSTPAPKAEEKKEIAAPDTGKTEEAPAKSADAEPKEKPEDSSASDETETAEKPKKSQGVQKRIDELTRQREDERRMREATEARLDRALAAVERLTGKPAAEAKQELEEGDPEPVRPVKAQFPDETAYEMARDQYTEAKATWIARREVKATIAERERMQADARMREENERIQSGYKGRVEKMVDKYPDYREVAESPDVAISIPMAHAIMASDHGPELQYHLGKNPAEAERISKLSVPQQLLALGRIEAKFDAQPAPAAKPEVVATPTPKPAVSSAPAPVKPVKAGITEADKPLEDLSMEEYAAKRKPQLNKRGPGARLN